MLLLTDVLSRFAAACQPGSGGSFLGIPTWYKYLDGQAVAGKCGVVFNFPYDAGRVLLAVVEILLRVGGMVALGFIIYGGFRFILSNGEPEQAKNARNTIINALIGLVIAISATAIVNLVGRNLL